MCSGLPTPKERSRFQRCYYTSRGCIILLAFKGKILSIFNCRQA